ncbi:hypothetical protein HK105_201670 [Polyrhizophydium stewartii]|uniref:Uncharacterized protein n=1 Tax=Polyrhizophydium stewartii TaxID=2732419 RepID=A0ABR4NH48_9FUNG
MSDPKLAAAADAAYSPRPASSATGIASYYKPTYDYDDKTLSPEERARNPRYCGGKLKLWEFVALHVLVIVNLFVIILVPVTYFSLVPWYLQYKIDQTGGGSVGLNELHVGQFNAAGVEFRLDSSIDALFPLPVYGGFEAFTLSAYDDKDSRLLDISLPKVDFWLNSQIKVNLTGNIIVDGDAQKNLYNLLQRFSSPDGLPNFKVVARFNLPVRALGVQIYKGIPLSKTINVGSIKADLKQLASLLPSLGSKSGTPNSKLRAKFDAKDIFEVTKSFALVLQNLGIEMRPTGTGLVVEAAFENPVPLTLEPIESLDFFVALEGANAIHVGVQQLSLGSDLLVGWKLITNIDFVYDTIDPAKVRQAITAASRNYANTGDFSITLSGPISISHADFVKASTAPLAVKLPVADLIKSALNSNSDSFLSDSGVKSILGNSTIRADVLSDKIQIGVGLVLPVILPVPRAFNLPFGTSLSIYGQDQKTIELDLASIQISRTDNAIIANTSITILPTNTDAAATALAVAINPILSANPKPSEINIRDLAFFPLNASSFPGPHFQWSDNTFKDVTLPFAVPVIDVAGLLKSVLNSPMAQTQNMPFKIRQLDVNQLTTAPGFGAAGTVDVQYPAGLPQLQVNVGYFKALTSVEDAQFISVELPNGLQFYPQQAGTAINALAVISRDSNLPSKLQVLADALLLGNSNLPASASLTGLTFGTSSTSNFVTFSKVKVELSSTSIAGLLGRSSGGASTSSLLSSIPAGTLSVQGADVAVTSGSDASLGLLSNVVNPFGVGLNVGAIGADALLGGGRLLSVSLPPIGVRPATTPLNLNVGLKIANGNNGLKEAVAQLVNAVLASDSSLGLLGGLTGIKLTPTGGSANAVIDQFSTVKIQTPVGPLLGMLSSTAPGPIDLSAVTPPSDLLNKLNPTIKGVDLAAKPSASLAAGGSFGYSNPLPISVKLPYAGLSVALANEVLVDVGINTIELARTSGTLQPSLGLGFKNGGNSATNVATLVSSFLKGGLDPGVGVRGIYFGTPNDRNDLLSAVIADVTSYLKPTAQTLGPQIKQQIDDLVNQILNGGASSLLQTRSDNLVGINLPLGISALINGLNIQFAPGSSINAGIGGSTTVPFPVNFDIPVLNVASGVDDLHAFDLRLANTKLSGTGTIPLGLSSNILVDDNDNLANKLADIVKQYAKTSSVPGQASLGNLFLGVSTNDYIDAFTKISGSLPLDPLFKTVTKTVGVDPGNLDIFSLLNSISLNVNNLGLDARAQRSLLAQTGLTFKNPLPVTVSGIGYIGATAGIGMANGDAIDRDDVVGLNIPAFGIGLGNNNATLPTVLSFPSADSIQTRVATFAKNLIDKGLGKTDEVFTVTGAGLGVSPTDYIKVFSKALVSIKSSQVLNQANYDKVVSILAGAGIDINKLPSALAVKHVAAKFNPSSVIDTGVSAMFGLPFPLRVGIPYVGVSAAVDSVPAFDIALEGVNLTGGGVNPLNVLAHLGVSDTDDLATKVAALVSAVLHKQDLPGTLSGGSAKFGVSSSDFIDTFAKVQLSGRAQKLADQILGEGYLKSLPLDFKSIFGALLKLDPKLNGAAAAALPGRILEGNAAIGFTNTFPVSVSGLGYISLAGGLDTTVVTMIKAAGFDIVEGPNSVSLKGDLFFPSSETVQNRVALLVDELSTKGLGQTSGYVVAAGISFGNNEATSFKFLSKAVIGFLTSEVISQDTLNVILGNSTIDLPTILGLVSLQHASAKFNPSNIIDASVQAGIKIPFPVSLRLPYVAAGTQINSLPTFDLALDGITIMGGGVNNVTLGAHVSVYDSDNLATMVAALVSAVLKKQDLPGTLGAGFLKLGVSTTDFIDTFVKVKLSITLEKLAETLLGSAGTKNLDLSVKAILGLLNRFSPSLIGAKVDALPKATIGLQAALGLNNPLPISLSGLGYITATAGVDTAPVTVIKANGFDLVEGPNTARIGANLFFPSSTDTQTRVAQLADEIWNRGSPIGNVTGNVVLTGISFGNTEATAFKFLSKVLIGLPANQVFSADTVKAVLGTSTIDVGGIVKNLTLNSANVDFNPNKNIDILARLSGLPLPTNIGLNVPFLAGRLDFIGSITIANFSTSTFQLALPGSLTTNLHVRLGDDGDAPVIWWVLVNAVINNQPLIGDSGIGQFYFGLDRENAIDTFSTIDLMSDATETVYNIIHLLNPDIGGLINSLELKVSDVAASTGPSASLATALKLTYNNKMNLTVTNFNYLTTSLMIDSTAIASLEATSPVTISPGVNTLSLQATLTFPHSDTIQTSVANFFHNLFTLGIGNTAESLGVSSVYFGYSKEQAIGVLSLSFAVALPSSQVINSRTISYLLGVIGFPNGLPSIPTLLKSVSFNSLSLDGSQKGKLVAGGEIAVKGLPIKATLDVGYVALEIDINAIPFLALEQLAGLHIKPTNDQLTIGLTANAVFPDSPQIEATLRAIVYVLTLPDGAPIPPTLHANTNVTKLMFGASKNDVIDTFVQVNAGLDLVPYVPDIRSAIKSVIGSVTGANSTVGLSLTTLAVDVVDDLTLSIDAGAALKGLPGSVSVNLPYAQAGILWDKSSFVSAALLGTTVANNQFSSRVLVKFAYNTTIAQQVTKIIGDVVFHRNLTVSNVITVGGVAFGSSQTDVVKTFSQAGVDVAINDYVQSAKNDQDKYRPLVLRDIQAAVVDGGIQTSVRADKIPIPLLFKPDTINAKITYQLGGAGDMYTVAGVEFTNVKIQPGQDLTFDLFLRAAVDDTDKGIYKPLAEDLQFLLTWADYAQHARLGYITFGRAGGTMFRPLDQGYLQAPDLYLWQPITIDITGANPFGDISHGLELFFAPVISFPNPGPLHLNAGELVFSVNDHNGKGILEASTRGDLTVLNNLEGGNDNGGAKNPLNGKIYITFPWNDINPIELFTILGDLFSGKLSIDLALLRNGKRIDWIDKAVKALGSSGALAGLPKLLGAILAHIKIKIFGIPIPLPGLDKFKSDAKAFMATLPADKFKIVGGEL